MNPEQQKKLDEYVTKIIDGASDVNPLDRKAIKAKVDALYDTHRQCPRLRTDGNVKVIWCESPFQQMVMPVLFEIALELGRNSSALKRLSDHLTLPLWKRALDSVLEQIGDVYEFDRLAASRTGKLSRVANDLTKKSWLNCKWPAMGSASDTFAAWDSFNFGFEILVDPLLAHLDDPELVTQISRHNELFRGPAFTLKNQVMLRLRAGVAPYLPSNRRFLRLLEMLHRFAKKDLLLRINEKSEGFKLAALIPDEINQAFGNDAITDFLNMLFRRSTKRNNALVLNCMFDCTLKAFTMSQPSIQFLNGLKHVLGESDSNTLSKLGFVTVDLASSVYSFSAFEKVCFVCDNERTVSFDDRGRAHQEGGPAVEFPDGYRLFAWHGTIVPQDIIEHPETITLGRIDTEQNAEVRRVLIERFGLERYIKDSDAYLRDADYCGNLYSKSLVGDEPLVVLEVTNSTPEPDGTLKRYFLRVPPDMTTSREAVAWTFGMAEDEYFPLVET